MSMYKLTAPCKIVDINGNIVDKEDVILFDNKAELIEYVTGDTDGDAYGSGLLRIRECDKDLYAKVGKMCNYITHLLWLEDTRRANLVIDAWKSDLSDLT